jgi:malate dehydrogenase (quinone)
VLEVIKKCFPKLLETEAGKSRLKAMIPNYDVDIKNPENAAYFHEVSATATQRLKLAR